MKEGVGGWYVVVVHAAEYWVGDRSDMVIKEWMECASGLVGLLLIMANVANGTSYSARG